MTKLSLHTVRCSPVLSRFLRDRQSAHTAIMHALPSALGDTPRAAANCLWALEEDILHVQTTEDFSSSTFGDVLSIEEVPKVHEGQTLMASLATSCLKTPPSDVPLELRAALKASGRSYRSRQVVVPGAERREWFIRRLDNAGFTIDPATLQLSPVRHISLGKRGGGIASIHSTFTATVTDAGAANTALQSGIGKGKNFGLGLIRPTKLA